MTPTDALLRLGVAVLDEWYEWHRLKQATDFRSSAWNRADGALEALDVVSDRLRVLLDQLKEQTADDELFDLENAPPCAPGLRVIIGGRQ